MGAQDEGSRRPPPPGPAPGQSAATAGTAPPPITPAQFLSWKQRKRLAKCAVISWWFPLARPWKSLVICGLLSGCTPDAEEAAEKAEAAQKRAADIASGAVQMNGRELFQHEPWVFDNNIY
ncbi:hypothetical protein CFC21_001997 [Triticum aestivum]|uniref:Uncharacterized protein n=1 Tax=Triticum aestivum TaxID=4565 RepID=A0A3B5XZD3_WHEAT|nr:uncharacterized protein LOC123050118 isoform X1 [Triticum aestivum]XP_048532419.1 uncharacterized protein LOC125511163 isoform X1 [Triticum urartu]KAF6983909.1 hypothetical protein CFC21_001997 [Triticum aestivum]